MIVNIAITGASGFLGQRFVDKLVRIDNDNGISAILILDRDPNHSGRIRFNNENIKKNVNNENIKKNVNNENIKKNVNNENIKKNVNIIKYDLSNLSNIKDKLADVDCIVHLAAFVPRSGSLKDDDLNKSIDINIQGTCNLMKSFDNVNKIIYASTVDVYGMIKTLPITEDHPTNPLSYYGASKLASEKYLTVFSRRFDIKTTILRVSTIYGPGELYNKAIPNFIQSVIRNDLPTIYGDGSDIRDYIYIDDVADAIILAIQKNVGGIYNIATGKGHSIKDIAERIIRMSGKRKDMMPVYKEYNDHVEKYREPTKFVFDISKAQRELGYYPKVGIDKGLRNVYEYIS